MLVLCQSFLSESSIIKSEAVHLTSPFFFQETFNSMPLGSTTHSAHGEYRMAPAHLFLCFS